MTAERDQAITDYAAEIFLRYFRPGRLSGVGAPRLDLDRDMHLLRMHWAISETVQEFISYVLSHRHEAQGLLRFIRRTDDAIARGRIDARATLLARAVTGHPSLVAYEEPIRSFNTGANQLVAWVVHHANIEVTRLVEKQVHDSAYRPAAMEAMSKLSSIKRIDALREPLKLAPGGRRPSPQVVRDATRSRRAIYKYGVRAYRSLQDVEAGDNAALASMLRSTLMAPLENWRRFELAVAAAIGQAVADGLGKRLELSLIDGSPQTPIIRCGRISIYWQRSVLFSPPDPEPSELKLKVALSAYGMQLGDDRPDLLVVDELKNRVMAVVEVKYVAGDTAVTRFREALGQIVRYARGYSDNASIDSLIRRSLIVTSVGAPRMTDPIKTSPTATDFPAIVNGSLKAWVRDHLLTSL